jgi:hypothetical protein
MSVVDTLDEVKKALSSRAPDDIQKAITQGTGLVAYDLQAPAKNVYPITTPIRNKVPRVGGGTGTATNWKVVSAIIGSGFSSMPWVPEGQRSAAMSYVTANKAASYVTLGEEDYITREAINAAKNFEDAKARMVMRLLQKTMDKEESAILFGNNSLALGTTPTPTLTASGTSGTLAAATYYIAAVAITYEGYQQQSSIAGLAQTKTITGMDGQTFTLNGGTAAPSAQASLAVTAGQSLTATVTPVRGAGAYAWYAGSSAATACLQGITTTNTISFSAQLSTGTQLSTALTATDNSTNSLAFDGLFAAGLNSSSGAYYNPLGAQLTSGGNGNVNEIDAMLLAMWNQYQVSPTVLYVNAQQAKDVKNKVLNGSSAPLLRYTQNGTSDQAFGIVANGSIKSYFNPFALDGGMEIPIKIHPKLPAGAILGYCDNLPVQYQSTEVPNLIEMKTRADYYQIDWPMRTRREEVGVYAEEVPAIYAPFALGFITNIYAG